jgi:hypothetical protein
MTYIAKPHLHHPTLTKNKVGYTRRDYEGRISTLCAGCGHDSISAAIIQACWELDIEPHRVAKLSARVVHFQRVQQWPQGLLLQRVGPPVPKVPAYCLGFSIGGNK